MSSLPPPPTTPDLHVLVAFAAKHISNLSRTPPRSSAFGNSRLLDAIAAICVSQVQSQVVAVALTVDSKARQVHLMITQNRVEPADKWLLEHIQKAWAILRDLSDHYRTARLVPLSQEPGGAVHTVAEEQFARHVYEFSWKVFMQHIRVWWPKLDKVQRRFGQSLRRKSVKEALGLKGHFQKAVLAVRLAVAIIGDEPLPSLSSAGWERLISLMDMATSHAKVILKHWHECQNWGFDFDETCHRGRSTAHDALSEITSLYRHLTTLTQFAYSPRPGRVFGYTLCVSFLPRPPPRLISLPCSPASWEVIIDHIRGHQEFADDDWPAKEAVELAEAYTAPQLCAPHPECALIAHLEASRRPGSTTPPPVGYVGVSHVSCSACALWIEAFNSRGGRRYRYRGSEGTWCWPWATPVGALRFEEDAVAKNVAEKSMKFLFRTHRFKDYEYFSWRSGERYPAKYGTFMKEELAKAKAKWEAKMEAECREMCVFGCTGRDKLCSCFDLLFG